MQIIFENKNKGSNSGRVDLMDTIIYARGLADVWKENMLEDLELREVEFRLVEEFLLELKKEFEEDKKLVKIVKLRRIEQEEKTIEEFIQEFQRAAKNSRYKRRTLVKEFKREMNGTIRRKLIEAKRPPTSIEQ